MFRKFVRRSGYRELSVDS